MRVLLPYWSLNGNGTWGTTRSDEGDASRLARLAREFAGTSHLLQADHTQREGKKMEKERKKKKERKRAKEIEREWRRGWAERKRETREGEGDWGKGEVEEEIAQWPFQVFFVLSVGPWPSQTTSLKEIPPRNSKESCLKKINNSNRRQQEFGLMNINLASMKINWITEILESHL